MNWRMRLADWISGGELSHLYMRKNILVKSNQFWAGDSGIKEEALRTIAAMETPSANATVKRMAKAAREASGLHHIGGE